MMNLSRRLQACADLVRAGSRLADVGCDHGYVPVALYQRGSIQSAVASDIHEAPLAACRQLVMQSHLEDKIQCVLSDGLAHVPLEAVDDILLAGMGGQLIHQILSACPPELLREKHIICNPMTHPEEARRFFYENGFRIEQDIIVADGRHHYNVMKAVYSGKDYDVSWDDKLLACWLGNIQDFSDTAYFIHLLHYLKNREKGGADFHAVIAAIEKRIM